MIDKLIKILRFLFYAPILYKRIEEMFSYDSEQTIHIFICKSCRKWTVAPDVIDDFINPYSGRIITVSRSYEISGDYCNKCRGKRDEAIKRFTSLQQDKKRTK
jgi:hypothetical protein